MNERNDLILTPQSQLHSIEFKTLLLTPKITTKVPPFLTQHERQALIASANIGGLNVLSLVNDGFSAAINYALTRNMGDAVDQYVLFYDMGAGKTSSTVVHFKTTEDPKTNNTFLSIQPVGMAWDQTLGLLSQLRFYTSWWSS
jgi:actin-like ATPase involved in cell morphogenesis